MGTAAIQLCRAFGNPVFVTAGADDKIGAVRRDGRVGRQQPTFR